MRERERARERECARERERARESTLEAETKPPTKSEEEFCVQLDLLS